MFQNKNLERHLTFFASCISLLKWALWETLYSHNIVANDFIALHKVNLCHTAYSISGRSSFRHTLCNFKWRFVLFENKKKTKTVQKDVLRLSWKLSFKAGLRICIVIVDEFAFVPKSIAGLAHKIRTGQTGHENCGQKLHSILNSMSIRMRWCWNCCIL